MTQPLDVAYVEIKPDVKDFSREVKKETGKVYSDLEKSTDQTTARIEASFKDSAEKIGELFRGVDGRLRDSRGRFAALGDAATDAFSQVGTTAARAASGGVSALSSALLGMLGVVGQLAAAGPAGLAILAAAFIALAATVTVAAAAIQGLINIALFGIGILPGVITGAIAGFGILAVAINGVAEAFQEESKAATAAGGAAIDNARQVAAAQRGVLTAQRELIRAREEERERIQDVNRELIAARTTEARLADNVLKAEHALQEAKRTGTPRAQIEAQLALDEANAALAEGKDRTQDLAAEKAKADKVGVEGSDRVLAAQERLLAAQDALAASQQRFSAGAVGQKRAIDSLSESAQAFVRALIDAKNELAPLAKRIQETFFSGTAELVPDIVQNIKDLEPEIQRVTKAFNGIFREILKFLGSDEAEDAVSGALGGLASFLEAITPSIGPLLEAFGEIIGDSEEFGDSLGGKVADGLLAIADFVKNVDLKQLFEDAKTAISDLTPIVTSLWNIFKNIWNILVPLGNIVLPWVALNFEFLAQATDVALQGFTWLLEKATEVYNWLRVETPKVVDKVKKWFEDLPENIKKLGPKLLEAGKSIIKKLWEGLSSAGGFLADVGKSIANNVIDYLNRNVIKTINNGLNKIEDGLNALPLIDGVDIPNIPNIPRLAKGGLVRNNTLAELGEGDRQEAVLPLEDPRAMQAVGQAIAAAGGMGGGGGAVFEAGSIVVQFNGAVPSEAEAFRTGQAVGNGIASRLAKRNIRTQLRTI